MILAVDGVQELAGSCEPVQRSQDGVVSVC